MQSQLIRRRPCGACRVGLQKRLTTNAPRHAPSSSSPSAAAPSIVRSPVQWYVSKLDTHPLTTKCLSSGLIAGSGDLLCQYLLSQKAAREGGEGKRYDWIRTARFFALGSMFTAPLIHKWYGFLMTSIPGTGVKVVAKRLALDQGFFSPLFLPAWISCLEVLERISPDDINGTADRNDTDNPQPVHKEDLYTHLSTRLRNDVPDILLVNWSVWIPSMTVMFAFVPSKFQVLYSNSIGFAWNAYLSWRTHEGESGGEGE